MLRDFPLGELLDLLSDHGNASFIRRVQLNDSLLEEIVAEQFLGKRKNGRRLASAGRPVEHQVGNLPGQHTLLQSGHDLHLMRHFLHLGGTTKILSELAYYFSTQGVNLGRVRSRISLSWVGALLAFIYTEFFCLLAPIKNLSILPLI